MKQHRSTRLVELRGTGQPARVFLFLLMMSFLYLEARWL